jgi:hypothetical protein
LDHVEALCRVIQISLHTGDLCYSKPMIVTSSHVNGEIKKLDSTMLTSLGCIGSRPHTIYDVVDNISFTPIGLHIVDQISDAELTDPFLHTGKKIGWLFDSGEPSRDSRLYLSVRYRDIAFET